MKQCSQLATGSRRGLLIALGLALAAAGLTGCFMVPDTHVAWSRGQLEASLAHNMDAVYAVAQKALAQLEFTGISDRKNGTAAQLVARTPLDKKVEITLQKVTERSTKVIIRVGVFGDETLSMSIWDRIKADL